MTNWVNVPESVIAAAPKCKIIARLGIGLDNIDVAAATRRGIVVTNVPDYCVTEVAEHALALMSVAGPQSGVLSSRNKIGPLQSESRPADSPHRRPNAGHRRLRQHRPQTGGKGRAGIGLNVLICVQPQAECCRLARRRYLVRIG